MQISESISRDMLRLFVWYPLRWTIEFLPVAWGMMLIRKMGDAHYVAARGGRKRFVENLRRLRLGDDLDEKRIVREYFRNHYLDRMLVFIFPSFGVREAEQFVEIEGLEHLDHALEAGKGVVLVHGHVGPAHLPLVVLARLGYRMKQIGLPSDDGLSWVGKNVAFRLRMRYEAKMPAEIINADSFLRRAFQWLHANGIIMTTGDGSGTERRVGKHIVCPFFGHPVQFPLGPSLLAEKTGSAVLPMFIIPGRQKRYRIVIERPLVSGAAGDEKVKELTRQFVARLEHYISRYPGYMHFLDRFSPGKLIEDGESANRAL